MIVISAVSVTVKKPKLKLFTKTKKNDTEVFLDATNGFGIRVFSDTFNTQTHFLYLDIII